MYKTYVYMCATFASNRTWGNWAFLCAFLSSYSTGLPHQRRSVTRVKNYWFLRFARTWMRSGALREAEVATENATWLLKPCKYYMIAGIRVYSFFLVKPRRLNLMCWRFGTPCLFHLHRRCKLMPPMEMGRSVPKHRRIKFRRRGFTQKNE